MTVIDNTGKTLSDGPRDENGRPLVQTMTDTEMLMETVLHLRNLSDVLTAIGQNPMVATMMPGLGK